MKRILIIIFSLIITFEEQLLIILKTKYGSNILSFYRHCFSSVVSSLVLIITTLLMVFINVSFMSRLFFWATEKKSTNTFESIIEGTGINIEDDDTMDEENY